MKKNFLFSQSLTPDLTNFATPSQNNFIQASMPARTSRKERIEDNLIEDNSYVTRFLSKFFLVFVFRFSLKSLELYYPLKLLLLLSLLTNLKPNSDKILLNLHLPNYTNKL